MKRFALALAALSSLLVAVCFAGTRPHYGGTLHVSTRAALRSLDPEDPGALDAPVLTNVSRLLFDTLIACDDNDNPQPSLAISWQADLGNQRWTFNLRSGVTLQDGRLLTGEMVASSLRTANPKWKVNAQTGTVVVEPDSSRADLPAEMVLSRNAIVFRDGNKLMGTGPFTIANWQPGKQLTLVAREDYWDGRAFLDSIEIEMGRNLREQMIALDLGKTDLIDVAPEQAHRAAAEGRRIVASEPIQLLALVFRQEHPTEDERKLREALSLSIDRTSLNSVILQGGGEPGGSLLPNWISGYAFLFPTTPDLKHARELRNEVRQATVWTLGYDSNDPMSRLLAERIALNARDAALSVQTTSAANADVRLTSISVPSNDARIALEELAREIGVNVTPTEQPEVDELYKMESEILKSKRAIPLLHVRVNYAFGATLRNWHSRPDGMWNLSDVWLGPPRP